MKRFILISCGCCWYYHKTPGGWRRKSISGADRRYIAPFVFSFEDAERIINGGK